MIKRGFFSFNLEVRMLKKIFVRLSVMLLLTGVLGTLGGCNTMAGAGKDVERAGQAIEQGANDAKKKM
jgi:predicted small secreted protein